MKCPGKPIQSKSLNPYTIFLALHVIFIKPQVIIHQPELAQEQEQSNRSNLESSFFLSALNF